MEGNDKKGVRFVVFTDVQYGDKEDTERKRFKSVLSTFQGTVRALEKMESEHIDFTIQLGDIVEGNDTIDKTREDMMKVNPLLSSISRCTLIDRAFHFLSLLPPSPPPFFLPLSPHWAPNHHNIRSHAVIIRG
mmetsp:Transcript_281/g.764  ORF Transcript_281/g.764 Transcript_281/m.764 type:complete len:133 (+) Transcript_281:76-474(+)